MASITILTPVHINAAERWNYLEQTFESFYRCNQSPVNIIHNMVDDRSPMRSEDLPGFCRQHKINLLKQFRDGEHRGYFDVFKTLVDSVQTEQFIYLEPDHYFYLAADFIGPALKMHAMLPDLHQVYLRAPLVHQPFRRDGNQLITHDGSRLHRIRIDKENTGWIGSGRTHESFSFMPSVFNTAIMKKLLADSFIPGGPSAVEDHFAALWAHKALVGYLNGQAFCYHIGAVAKSAPGGYLSIGDTAYEKAWSSKQL